MQEARYSQMMDPKLYFAVYLCIVSIIFASVLVFWLWKYKKIKKLMKKQALKRDGIVIGSFFLPRLKFSYKNIPAVVTSVPGNKNHQAKTQLNMTLILPSSGDCMIYNQSIRSELEKKLGGKEIMIGNEEFDREYVLRSDDERFPGNLLTRTLQNILIEMKKEKLSILLKGTWLTVEVPKVIKTEEEYDQLFDMTFALVDRLQEL